MVAHFGLAVVHAYMRHVQDNAEEAVRRVIGVLQRRPASSTRWTTARAIAVAIAIDRAARAATIDFTGTSAQLPTTSTRRRRSCTAAVLYVFRTLVDDEIPLNAGCLKPLTIVIPEGSMLSPRYPAAVVAGNVETSQCVTDALYGALGVMAASQGTMNNFTFGNARYQYYETICGGSGAGPDFDGASAVQTHMTNSRLTDPEVLEWRFPVRLESFAIRARQRRRAAASRRRRRDAPRALPRADDGGDPGRTTAACAPFGIAGGGAGAVGRNWVERADGTRERLRRDVRRSRCSAGDVFVIETPGGGGFGRPVMTDARRAYDRGRAVARKTSARVPFARPIAAAHRPRAPTIDPISMVFARSRFLRSSSSISTSRFCRVVSSASTFSSSSSDF